jgi:hypothetical protein
MTGIDLVYSARGGGGDDNDADAFVDEPLCGRKPIPQLPPVITATLPASRAIA